MYDFSSDPNLSDLEKVVLSNSKLRKAMKAVQKHAARSEWDKAMPSLLALWKAMPEDPEILLIMSYALVNLGMREEAIGVLKQYLSHHTPTPAICSIIMSLANAMEIFSVAEKIGRILLEMEPNEPSYYCDFVMVLSRQEKYDEAVEICQSVIPIFKDHAELWNVLGAAVQYRDGFDKAIVFYEEALRLNPKSLSALHNISMAVEQNGYDKARPYLERALEVSPKNTEVNMGLAFCKFWEGDLGKETWENYSYRMHPTRSNTQHIHYTHKLPEWKGEDLSDKTIFATCEQGIGDEVMFGSILPRLYEDAKQLLIGVDRRLVSIMQRSFPNAIVCGYGDHVKHGYRYRLFPDIQRRIEGGELDADYYCPLASIPSFYWRKPEDIEPHPNGYLVPDSDRVEEFAERLRAKTDKPIIGFAWTSGNASKTRGHHYPNLDDMGAIFKLKDRYAFLNLQYGDHPDDLEYFRSKHGVDLIHFDDVDLRNDIEANLALMANCERMVAVASAPGMFAMACGVTTYVMTAYEPWWVFGNPGRAPFMRDGMVVSGGGWSSICAIVADKLSKSYEAAPVS